MEVLLLIAACANFSHAMKAILMDPFDPSKITGTWLVARRNAQLLEKSFHCVRVELLQNGNNGDFTMLGSWVDEKQIQYNHTFLVIDDTEHPAKFVFKSDTEKIAISFLGSDYENWAVAFGKVSLKESYFVGYRKLPGDPIYASAIQKVLDANNVGKDFFTIDHSNC